MITRTSAFQKDLRYIENQAEKKTKRYVEAPQRQLTMQKQFYKKKNGPIFQKQKETS
jgi:hypothetical protein